MANAAAQQQAQRAAAVAAGMEAQRKLAGKKRKAQEKAPNERVSRLLWHAMFRQASAIAAAHLP
jgi:hypothetical protein